MKALRDNNIITNEVFMVQTEGDTQIIKFGGYDQDAIEGDLTVLECSDTSSYTLNMKNISINGTDIEFIYTQKVRLDISQPYVYVPN